jgi:uncharacterized protein YqgC (DUF456 family)
MDILYWTLVSILFLLSFVSLIYPILPGVLFLIGGFVLYGLIYDFSELSLWFWIVEALLVALLFVVDYLSNLYGVTKRGGSRAAVWGSTIGLIIGPFVIPVVGILIVPFLGAILAELIIHRKPLAEATKIGIGTLLGFLGGMIVKAALQIAMISLFIWIVVF